MMQLRNLTSWSPVTRYFLAAFTVLVLSTGQVLSFDEKITQTVPSSVRGEGEANPGIPAFPVFETIAEHGSQQGAFQTEGEDAQTESRNTEAQGTSERGVTAEDASENNEDRYPPSSGIIQEYLDDDEEAGLDKRFLRGLTDKRFIQGLTGKRFIQGLTDKRFMRGLTDKRFIQGLTAGKRFIHGLTGKRFIQGLTADKRFINGLTDKRFIQGLTGKRFIQGLTGKRFIQGLTADKRFINGLTDKRFINGLTDKRFIQGLTGKRFLQGLTGKRFIQGLTGKRFSPALGGDQDFDDQGFMEDQGIDKRFIVGLQRRQYPSFSDSQMYEDLGGDEGSPSSKRFIKGFNKRFIRGFTTRSDSEDIDDFANDETVIMNKDKRFLHGLVPNRRFANRKRFIQGLVGDKRFLHGLVPSNNKRFIQGIVPNSKRFLRGLVSDDKRFIHGLQPINKRPVDDQALATPKRFIKGFVKRAVNDGAAEQQSANKRFIQGLVRKSPEMSSSFGDSSSPGITYEKKFMRGLVRKSDDEPSDAHTDKRFIQGLVRKATNGANGYFRFDDGLDELEGEGFKKRAEPDLLPYADDKRFMRGLVKKETDYENGSAKRFIKGFTKKAVQGYEGEKRFLQGLVKKEAGPGIDKKFIKGFTKKEATQEIDKKFMKGFTKKEAGPEIDKKFMKGFTKKEAGQEIDKKFMKGFIKKEKGSSDQDTSKSQPYDNDGRSYKYESEMAKKFIRGYVKKEAEDNSGEVMKTFLKGYVKKEIDAMSSDPDLSKKFMKGFTKKENSETNESEVNKQFNRGLAGSSEKTVGDSVNGVDNDDFLNKKRFLKGFVKKSGSLEDYESPLIDATNKENQNSGSFGKDNKRFIKGFTKREAFGHGNNGVFEEAERQKRALAREIDTISNHESYRMKRSAPYEDNGLGYDDTHLDSWFKTPYFSSALSSPSFSSSSFTVPDKKFIMGLHSPRSVSNFNSGYQNNLSAQKRFVRGLIKRYAAASGSDEYDKRFIKGFVPKKRFIVGLPDFYAKRLQSTNRPEMDGRAYPGYSKRFIRGLVHGKRNSVWPDEQKDSYRGKSLNQELYQSLSDVSPQEVKSTENINSFSKRFIMGLTKHSSGSRYSPYFSPYSRKNQLNFDNGYSTRGKSSFHVHT